MKCQVDCDTITPQHFVSDGSCEQKILHLPELAFYCTGGVSEHVLGHLLCEYVIGTQPAVSCGYQDETAER